MENQVVLLNYAPETPFRYILSGRGKIILLYYNLLHVYRAGRSRPLEELSLVVMRNTKHHCLSLPLFIILIQCLHSATVPLLY